MHVRDGKRYLLIGIMTLAVNVLLFTGLPNLLPENTAPTDVESLQVVDFVRQKPKSPRSVKKDTPPKPPPEPPRVIPRKALNPARQHKPQQLNMKLPDLDFKALPNMASGIPVTAPPESPSVAPGPRDFFGLAEVDQVPVATMKTRPVYPYRARRLNLDGEVDIKFLVDTGGRVSRITILRASPSGLFEQSVLKALASWRFTPGKVNGRPVNTWVTTTIVFRVDDL